MPAKDFHLASLYLRILVASSPVQDLLLSTKHLFVEAMLHFSGVSSSQSQMLALTDAAFARLCIAASRVDPRERAQWLQTVAAKLEALCTEEISSANEDDRTPEARRKALERERQDNDLHLCKLWLSGGALQRLTEQFILEGWLTPDQADDHGRVEKAIAFLLEQHTTADG